MPLHSGSPRPGPCALAVRGWGIRPGWKGLAAPVAGRACGQTDAPAREIGVEPQADVQRSGLPSHQPTAPGRRRRQHRCNQRDGARDRGRDLSVRRYEDNVTEPAKVLYRCPNMRSTFRVVPLDINPPTYMRGPGVASGTFALECAMDDLAHRLGMDPIELRLRNEPERDQAKELPFSTRRLTECFRQGANAFGWSRRNATPRSNRDGNQLIGIGTAAAAGFTTLRDGCTVLARINADGTADVATGTSDMGPGTYTAMTQVAADALGLPISWVRFALGDSQFPRRPCTRVRGPWPASAPRSRTSARCCGTGSFAPRWSTPDHPLSGLRPPGCRGRRWADVHTDEPPRGEFYQRPAAPPRHGKPRAATELVAGQSR